MANKSIFTVPTVWKHCGWFLLALCLMGEAATTQPASRTSDSELLQLMAHLRTTNLDRIPSIDTPTFTNTKGADRFLRPSDPVVGVHKDGEAKAYPVKFLDGREVVNDSLGQGPITVTWWPIVPRSIVYVPRINLDHIKHRYSVRDSILSFGVSGILREGALVMYDRSTYSLWTQKGKAIAGPLVGLRLRKVLSERVRWDSWRQRFPQTLVMLPPSLPGEPEDKH